MPVPALITDISATLASNASIPSGGESSILTDDYLRTAFTFIAQLRDGVGFTTAVRNNVLGSASVPAFSFVGDTNTGAYSPAADTYALTTGGTERVRVDSGGNVGIGVTPSAWGATTKAIQVATAAFSSSSAAYRAWMSTNAYNDGTNWKYQAGTAASLYEQAAGSGHLWFTAPSGTAGNTISFTQAMTLDVNGKLLIGKAISGTTVAALKLELEGRYLSTVTGVAGYSFGTTGSDFVINNASNGSSEVERMRIDSNGNIGFGTPVPKVALGFGQTSSGTGIAFQSTDETFNTGITSKIRADITGSGNGSLVFDTFAGGSGGGERMRIDSSGNVGIGITSPNTKLQVDGAIRSQTVLGGTPRVSLFQSGVVSWDLENAATTGTFGIGNGGGYAFRSESISSGTAIYVDSARNVGIGTVSPSEKLVVQGGGKFTAASAGFGVGAEGAIIDYVPGDSIRIGHVNGAAGSAKPVRFLVGGNEQARIASNGNVGIGNTSPAAKIDVTSTALVGVFGSATAANAYVGFRYNGTILGYVGNGAGVASGAGTADFAIGSTGSRSLVFGANDTERARLTPNGYWLVGTFSPGFDDVWSCALRANGVGDLLVNHPTAAASGTAYAQFGYAGVGIGSISQAGTTGVLYSTTSDRRLKTDITPAGDAGALLDAVQVRQFNWLSDGSHQRYGFIAQELLQVVPEAVHAPADPDEMMAVDYSKLVPMLVKEVQSLRARVAALES